MAKRKVLEVGYNPGVVDEGHGEASPPQYGCRVREFEPGSTLLEKAANAAVDFFAMNAPKLHGLSRVLSPAAYKQIMKPEAIAVLVDKKWDPTTGADLGVAFMENTTAELQSKIIEHMNAWWDLGVNVHFRPASKSNAEVRISRGQGGYYSYLGTDVLHIPSGEQTMNLEAFVIKTPLSEYKRVVRHETGHTLGFPHEHMRQALVALLNRAKTIAYFERTQGWTEQEVVEQVLTPLSEAQLQSTPADRTSIMCYQLPGSITNNGQPIPGGTDIDDTDSQFAAKLYPRLMPSATTTTTTTTAGAPPVAGQGLISVDAGKKLITCTDEFTVFRGGRKL